MTKTNEKHITAIKLRDGGNKGLSVDYAMIEIRNNREFVTEYPGVKKKFPIHEELDATFKWLRGYLLELCNYTEKELLIDSTEITGIKYSDKGFIIKGKLSTIADKSITLESPLITMEDGYSDFDAVCKIMDGIYTETKEYMDGKKVLSDIQYVINLNKGNNDFDSKTFENLSEEEQWKIANEFMAKNKCIVTKLDDLEEDFDEEETMGGLPISKEQPIATEEVETVLVPFVQEVGIVGNQPETVLTTSVLDDDNFIIPVVEVKKSTAKKVKA
jgi:hypothetical protein